MATLPAGLSADQLRTLAFVTGLDARGRLAAESGWDLDADDPAADATARKWAGGPAGSPGGVVTYRFDDASAWSPDERQAFRSVMALWSSVADIAFQEVAWPGAAQLDLRRDTGAESGGAYAQTRAGRGTVGGDVLPAVHDAHISIDTRVEGWTHLDAFDRYGGYGVLTVVHEIGHVLGLAHSGPYNGGVDPATQQLNATDTLLWSAMSYIAPTDRDAAYFAAAPVAGTNWGYTADGYARVPTTPQMLDVLAVQQLYGPAAGGALGGGQTYGFNCTVAGDARPFFDFTVNAAPVVTLWNGGGGNTLDLSGYAMACTVDLNPGAFSSVAGLTNNLAIAYGTRIDAVVGGAGDDVFTPNTGDDVVDGGGGRNTLVLRGARPEYQFARTADGALRVTAAVPGLAGTVTARNVQTLRFGDQTTLDAAELLDALPASSPAPQPVSPAVASPVTAPASSAPPSATAIAGLAPGEDTGVSVEDGVTSVTRPWIRGVAAPGVAVALYRLDDAGDPAPAGTATAGADGAWGLRLDAPLADGAHAFVAVALGAGGAGPASEPFRLVVDTRPPAPPAVADLRPGAAGGVVLAGYAEPGGTVALFDAGAPVATAAVGADGAWTAVLPGPAVGDHAVTAAATDAAGNASAGSSAVAFAVRAGQGVPVAFEATRRSAAVLAGPDGDVLVRVPDGASLVRGAGELHFLDGRLVFDPSDPAAQVARLYQAGLGRQPDPVGLSYWTGRLRGGDSLGRLAGDILGGPEWVARSGVGGSDAAFVETLYRNVLGRAPDPAGGEYWTGRLAAGAERASVLAAISGSEENERATAALVRGGLWDPDEGAAEVARLYDTVLGRPPDAAGLGFWTRQLDTGALTLPEVAERFVGGPEFRRLYGALGERGFVEAIYANTLRRPGDADGVAYWTARLEAGLSRAGAVVAFSESEEHRRLTAPDVLGSGPDRLGVVTI